MNARSLMLAAASFLVIFIIFSAHITHVNLVGFNYGQTDFFKFYESVRYYFSGQNLYSPALIKDEAIPHHVTWAKINGNLNPPFLTALMLPFYFFSYASALKIWIILSLIFLCVSVPLILTAFPDWKLSFSQELAILAGFLVYLPNTDSLVCGQVTALILLFLIGTWLSARENKDILAGVWLGLACGIKLFLGLFFVFFFIFRRWRLLFSAGMTYGITLLTGFLLFGKEAYSSYQAELQHVNWYTASWNASFLGFFTRIFSGYEKNKPIFDAPFLAHLFAVTACFLLTIYFIYLCYKLYRSQQASLFAQKEALDIGFSLTLTTALLLCPLGWVYYFPFLLINYCVLFDQSCYLKRGLWLQLSACALAMISTFSGGFIRPFLITTKNQIWLNSGYGFYFLIGFSILFGILAHQRIAQQFQHQKQAITLSENRWILLHGYMLIFSMIVILKT